MHKLKVTEENSIYLRESNNPLICLTDNNAVVEAAKKIKRGLYSASPRLQTLITSVQRYGINFCHISGKLPTDLINVADFSSRNPVECSEKSCKVCQMSSDLDQSYSTVRSIQLESPISSRKAWKEIQESCEDCLMAIGHIKSGIRRKEKNRYNVRKLINKATIAEDCLLVVMEQFSMELKPIETIVVPRDFSISVITLLHSEESNQHQSASQML